MILRSKVNGRNRVTVINTWAVAIFRYGAGIIQWKASELKDLDKKLIKKNDDVWSVTSKVDRLYVERNGWRR